jgi:hypothetical protein
VGAHQFDFAAIGVDPSGHATLLVGEPCPAIGAVLLDSVGFVLHGFLHQQSLQFQAGLADMLLDKAQTLLRVLLQLRQAPLEVSLPAGDVLFEQAILLGGKDLIDQGFHCFGAVGRACGG